MLNPTEPQTAMLAMAKKIETGPDRSGSGRPSAEAPSGSGSRRAGT